MTGEAATGRAIWRLTGKDRLAFLQGVVSNDVRPLEQGPGIVWTALLTPQGKYLADFFVVRLAGQDAVLLDLPEGLATPTMRRLQMYRLRADVAMEAVDAAGLPGPWAGARGALPDPRHPTLAGGLWDGLRRTGIGGLGCAARGAEGAGVSADLVPDDSYLLEMGFDRLNGVDFRKGCYVGQEVTARMKHKTELKKGLVQLRIDGMAAPGTRSRWRMGARQGGWAPSRAPWRWPTCGLTGWPGRCAQGRRC